MKTLTASGAPVLLKRATYNEIAATVNARKSLLTGTQTRPPLGNPGTVYIRNGTGTDLEQFDALALYNPLVLPSDDFAEFANRSVWACDAPTGSDDAVAVLQEPIPAGKIGRAVVGGMTHVYLLRETGSTDMFATMQDGSTVLKSGPAGARIVWEESAADGEVRLATILLPSGGGVPSEGGLLIKMQVLEVLDNYLRCHRANISGYDTLDEYVAKPYLLRAITSRNGIGYTYTNGYTRVATSGGNTESQVIVPSYYTPSGAIGDVIFASPCNYSGVVVSGADLKLIDVNADGRAWAKQ